MREPPQKLISSTNPDEASLGTTVSSRKKLTTWLGVLVGLLGQTGVVIRVTVFDAAMGSIFGAAIVAMDHDLDLPLVTLMAGLGVPLSFPTLPGCCWLLERLA